MAPLIKTQFGLDDTRIGLLQGPAFSTLYALGLLAAAPEPGGARPHAGTTAVVSISIRAASSISPFTSTTAMAG